jgi:hypothetical protein
MDEYISKEFMLKNLEADKIHNAEHCEPVTVQIVELFIRYVKEFPAADVQPLSVVAEHIKNRLYETALNTNGAESYTIAAMAERIDFWINELRDGDTE